MATKNSYPLLFKDKQNNFNANGQYNNFILNKNHTFSSDAFSRFSKSANSERRKVLDYALTTVTQWCESKSMAVAPTKTFHVQFGPSNPEAKYFVNNVEIERKEVVRDLGFYIKNDCSIDEHVQTITANANKRYYSIFKKIITSDEEILIKIFNIYVLLEYGSPVFNIPKKIVIKQLENGQRAFTRMMFKRKTPNSTVIPSYQERLKLFQMDSLLQRRMIADITMAYDFLVASPNPDIDLHFIPLSHRSNGYYSSKFTANGKYYSTHFSTRFSSLLRNVGIYLNDFENVKQLRNHLSKIDLTDEKLLKYSN